MRRKIQKCYFFIFNEKYDKIKPINQKSTIILGTEHIFSKIESDEFFDLFSDYLEFQMGGNCQLLGVAPK